MTMTERLKELKKDEVLYISPPQIQHMISGTTRAIVNKQGVIELVYEDGSVESRKATVDFLDMIDMENFSFFSFVSFVQEGRE